MNYKLQFCLNYFLYVCICLQCILHPTLENIYACTSIGLGWCLINKKIATEINFIQYPLVTLILYSFALFYFYTAVPVTLFEGKPVTFNLERPFLTFTLQFVYLLLLIAAFDFFVKTNFFIVFQKIFNGIGLYYKLSTKEIWILAIVGLLSFLFSNGQTTIEAENRSSIDRLLEGFVFLTYLPFVFISVPYGWNQIDSEKKWKIFAFCYFIVLFIFAVMTNRRHAIFGYLIAPILLWIIKVVRNGTLKTAKISFLKSIGLLLVIFLVFGPLTDFCLAMSVLRAKTSEIGGMQLLLETYETYKDKSLLEQQYRFFSGDQIDFNSIGYTEYYVDNILLNRFCNMKPIDNSVKYMTKVDWFVGDSYMKEKLKDNIIYLVPTPIIKFFDANYNKFKDARRGFHDYLINRATNTEGGGYRVGGDIGIGFATMGILFIPFVVIFYAFVFSVVQSFCEYKTSFLSAFAISQVFEIFYLLQSNHGFVDEFSLLFRIWPQQLLLIIILIKTIRIMNLNKIEY